LFTLEKLPTTLALYNRNIIRYKTCYSCTNEEENVTKLSQRNSKIMLIKAVHFARKLADSAHGLPSPDNSLEYLEE